MCGCHISEAGKSVSPEVMHNSKDAEALDDVDEDADSGKMKKILRPYEPTHQEVGKHMILHVPFRASHPSPLREREG